MIDAAYLQEVHRQIEELESKMARPKVSGNQTLFRAVLSEHAHLKKLAHHADHLFAIMKELEDNESLLQESDIDEEFKEMAEQEVATLKGKLPAAEKALQRALIPPNPEDASNVIIEIRAGTGGDEAALFAADLYRMYMRFAEAKKWKTTTLDASASNIGGYKEVVFSVEGENIYRQMRYESGVHRVQRIPVTEASGRIHTSAATVAVLPETEETEDIDIKPEEIRIDIFRSSGPGGQSVNTTDSAVRITHIDSGIVVQCQDEKSQHRNKDKAMRVLRARLLDRIKSEEAAKAADERRSKIGTGDRSERVRTYNFPQNRLSDHRINLTLYSLDKVMEGDLAELIEALYDADIEEQLQTQMNKVTNSIAR